MLQFLKKNFSLFIFLILIVSIFSCEKATNFSKIPIIKFKKIIFEENEDILGNKIKKIELTFSVIDGDGDIGLEELLNQDTIVYDTLYYYNLFTTLYVKENGSFRVFETEVPNYRIPYIEIQGRNRVLKADIKIDIEYAIGSTETMPYDTIKYDLFIYDRASNKSNLITSPVSFLKKE